ncbi:MAG: fumarylacetoacetate hydrolase family protein [Actinomycetes bacterium]
MSLKIAVIATAENPFRCVTYKDSKFFSIEGVSTLTDALHMRADELRARVNDSSGKECFGTLQPPISPEIEIWGAGVTYLRSRDARKEESGVPDVYQRVYEADRPELFFKSHARRTVGTAHDIGIRADSAASVPEPEVAIVVNIYQEIIGLTICNDVTARTIEGENPLYLSQAKIYVGSTAMGPMITPIWDVDDIGTLGISAHITRGTELVWQAQTSLGALHRTFEDLVSYLFRCQIFPDGVILSTGTGIVPPLDISLEDGDVVTISVDEIGILSNRVVKIDENIHNLTLGIGS